MTSNKQPSKTAFILWRFTFLLSAIISAGWWYGLAGGFSLGSLHFWSNTILAPALLCFFVISIVFIFKKKDRLFLLSACSYLVGLITFVLSAWIIFPRTMQPLYALPLLLYAGQLAWLIHKDLNRKVFIQSLPLALGACAAGIFLPWSQRGLDAATQPLNSSFPAKLSTPIQQFTTLKFNNDLELSPGSANVIIRHGGASLNLDPLLTFDSLSPDRSWTIFARRSDMLAPSTQLDSYERKGDYAQCLYAEKGEVNRSLRLKSLDKSIEVEAFTRLDRDIYSHLNTFCDLVFAAPGKLAIGFSPCPEKRIDIMESDYPVGRPARFAYVDKNGIFRVVEASSAEKGPFTTLAEGKINKDEPFTLTLYADGKKVFSIEMNDWIKQASTQLSPTAGWGVAENAIEFSLSYNQAFIYCTLAGTSVGRGYHSVGHKAGTYRNKMKIKKLFFE